MRPTLLRTLTATALAAVAMLGVVFVPVAADDPKPPPKAAARPTRPPEAEIKAKLELIHAKARLEKVADAYRQYVFTYGKVPTDVTDGNGKPLLSWRVHLLPFMEQNNVQRLTRFDKPWDHPDNELVARVLIKLFMSADPGPPYVHNNHKYLGTRVRRISGPTGANTDFAKAPAKYDADARNAISTRLHEIAYPVIIESGIPTPWLKPDEDFAFDPKAKVVKLLGSHPDGALVATTTYQGEKLVLKEPDAATFADWMAKGAKATIESGKLHPLVGPLTDADRLAAEMIENEWRGAMERKQQLEERRLKLRLELLAKEAPAGDPDPLRMAHLLGEINSMRNDRSLESEVERLEEELKKRAKK